MFHFFTSLASAVVVNETRKDSKLAVLSNFFNFPICLTYTRTFKYVCMHITCYNKRNLIYIGGNKTIPVKAQSDKMTYTETDTDITDVVTLREQKQRGAGTIYIKPDFFKRIELPRDTSLKITYRKNEKKITIETL